MIRDVTIIEGKRTWLWAEMGVRRRTLDALIEAVKADSRKLVQTQGAVVDRITYTTNTPEGHILAMCYAGDI